MTTAVQNRIRSRERRTPLLTGGVAHLLMGAGVVPKPKHYGYGTTPRDIALAALYRCPPDSGGQFAQFETSKHFAFSNPRSSWIPIIPPLLIWTDVAHDRA